MKLVEYMKRRNGLTKAGTVKFAMSSKEFEDFKIINVRGWAKKHRHTELDDGLCTGLLSIYSKFSNKTTDDKYIYLIYSDTTGNSKIGISSDPKQRKNNIQSSSGMELDLIAVWKVNHIAREVEKELQYCFKNVRHIGEWFLGHLKPEDIEANMPCTFKRVL